MKHVTIKRCLICLLALCLLIPSLAACQSGNSPVTGGTTTPPATQAPATLPFDYENEPLQAYINLLKEQYTGLNVDLDAYYDEFVQKGDIALETIDDAFVDEYIAYLLLQNRTAGSSSPVVNGSIGYGDDVYLYIISATVKDENGKDVPAADDYFVNAYTELKAIVVGTHTLGEEFDAAIIGKNPLDSYSFTNSHVALDKLAPDAVISISYTATIEGEDQAEVSVVGKRVDLALNDNDIAKALLEHAKNPDGSAMYTGEKITFTREEDIDEDGTVDQVKYEGVVNFVMLREPQLVITAKLPEDYFIGDDYKDEAERLNGKEVTFSLVISHYLDYKAYTTEELAGLNANTLKNLITNKFGYTQLKEKSDVPKMLAEYRTYIAEELKKEQDEAVKTYQQNAIWKHLTDAFEMTEFPKASYDAYYEDMVKNMETMFESYLDYYGQPVYTTIDDYAAYYYGYDKEEHETFEKYAEYLSKLEVEASLIRYAILKAEGLTVTEEDAEKAYKELVQEIIDSVTDYTVTEKEVVKQYGEDVLRRQSREQLVLDRVNEFLLKNNTFVTEAE